MRTRRCSECGYAASLTFAVRRRDVTMDIAFAKAFHFLAGLFMPLFITAVATFFVCAFLIQRGVLNRPRQKALARIVAGIAVPFVLACICCAFLQTHFAKSRLRSLATQGADSILIRHGSKQVEIKDPAVITNLFSIICRGHGVSGHHSHPVDKMEVFVPRIGYTYSLGKDSDVRDEFWLDWVAYPGSDPDIDIGNIRQFRSSELTNWLKDHVGSAESGRREG